MLTRELAETKTKEVLASAKEAIEQNNISRLNELLEQKYQILKEATVSEYNTDDLSMHQAGTHTSLVPHILPFLTVDEHGAALIEHAVKFGNLEMIDYLTTKGMHVTMATFNAYEPRVDNPAVTEHIFMQLLNSKIQHGNARDLSEIIDRLNKYHASKKIPDDMYQRILASAKDKTYSHGTAEQLKTMQPIFKYDAAYIAAKGIPRNADQDKKIQLTQLNKSVEVAQSLQAFYTERNQALLNALEAEKKVASERTSIFGIFHSNAREEELENLISSIKAINTNNEATRFKETIKLLIAKHNTIQTELDSSLRASIGISRSSVTKDQLSSIISQFSKIPNNVFENLYQIEGFPKIQLANMTKINSDESIIEEFKNKLISATSRP